MEMQSNNKSFSRNNKSKTEGKACSIIQQDGETIADDGGKAEVFSVI